MTNSRKTIKILHITPHLGGGVGKALSSLAIAAKAANCDIKRTFLLLEIPEKTQFVNTIQKLGTSIKIASDMNEQEIHGLLARADVVQLEWWNHPATFKFLCNKKLPPIRLLVWCHVSGTYNPIIPPKLIKAAERFIFTSPCSYQTKTVIELESEFKSKLAVVSSGGGLSGLPKRHHAPSDPLNAGYIGSLNFSKLNPDYIEFLNAVKIPNFKVSLIGDILNQNVLQDQCNQVGKPNLLDFRGYTTNIVKELSSINVLAYLLNPLHYGTAEIALLEAMAMGIVPVVLDNLAEKAIIENNVTGVIVHTPTEFATAIEWLADNPAERIRIAANAARHVRETFTAKRTNDLLNSHYKEIMNSNKKIIDFKSVFGSEPTDWFLSCQPNPARFSTHTNSKKTIIEIQDYSLNEKTKGSVFHFLRNSPNDLRLAKYAESLKKTT